MIRTLVDRFHALPLPTGWEVARRQLERILRDLERILGVLHPKVEYPNAQLVAWIGATANTTINSTSAQDITGATVTVTPAVDTRYLVSGCFDATCTALGALGQNISCRLDVNGVVESHRANWAPHVVDERDSLCHSWAILVSAGVATTIKLVALTANAATTFTVNGSNTGLTLLAVPEPYRVPN